jgi:hypothetical protein
MSLVKLVRAVDATSDNAFCYEFESHSISGSKESGVIKDNIKNQTYGKALRMTSKKNHAVRYMNTWNWVVISEVIYNELLNKWTSEE